MKPIAFLTVIFLCLPIEFFAASNKALMADSTLPKWIIESEPLPDNLLRLSKEEFVAYLDSIVGKERSCNFAMQEIGASEKVFQNDTCTAEGRMIYSEWKNLKNANGSLISTYKDNKFNLKTGTGLLGGHGRVWHHLWVGVIFRGGKWIIYSGHYCR